MFCVTSPSAALPPKSSTHPANFSDDADDENVRTDHVAFGEAGVRDRGTNYLEIIGKESEGTLAYPGDLRAPVGQVVNCRCLWLPEG